MPRDKIRAVPAVSERNRIIEQFEQRFSASSIRRKRLNRLFQGNGWLVWIQVLTGVKRCLDLLTATVLLVVFSPLLAVLYVAARLRGGGVERIARLGRWGCVFHERAFTSGPFKRLPAIFNVWTGDMSLIGPRAVSPGQVPGADRAAWRRFNIRPGLICLWWIRKRANIDFGSEFETDSEYLDSQSFWGDIAIAMRAIPAAFYGEGVALAPDRISLMGIPVDNLTMDEAIEAILRGAQAATPTQLCFVNADCVNIACRDTAYRELLRNAGIVLADGIGVKLAGRILNTNIRQNVNGTDLFPRLCAALENQETGLYLLGGQPGVVEAVAQWIGVRHPGVKVRGHHHGFFTEAEAGEITRGIRNSGAEILLVAFGVPKQEKWICAHLPQTGARIAIGVGG
ncbi:MAG: WecB/TagA/CpsF family glycosyltransferase, partial [Acidobacteriota bacterium]